MTQIRQGILVETAEDRRRQQIKDIMNETDVGIDGEEYKDLKFVHIPHDQTLPIKELTMKIPAKSKTSSTSGMGGPDALIEELKPFFSALSKKIDMNLFQDQATRHLGAGDVPQISQEALKQVASQGQVETFPLVHPLQSNNYTGVNVYLDEVGMLKRLPLNQRIMEIAEKAGFNPPPKFYGDVFLGRVRSSPSAILENIDFTKNDNTKAVEWLNNATMENLEHQTMMNSITGKTQELQPDADGENGVAKSEQGYKWTQTDEEVEIVIPLKNEKKIMTSREAKAAGLKVKYFPKKLRVEMGGEELLALDFYASVDPDGCTWTLDTDTGSDEASALVVTCEKVDGVSWPRITV